MALEKTVIIQNAQKFTIKGQIDKAIDEWQKLIKETPNDGNIYNIIGDLYLKKNNNSEAIAAYLKAASAFDKAGFSLKTIAVYKKIIKINPENYDIYIKLADLDAERGLIGNAIEEYLKVIKHNSQSGFNKDSIPIYKKIVNLDSNNVAMRTKLADLCVKEGQKADAVEQHIKIAIIYKTEKKTLEAEETLRRALSLDPGHSQASRLLEDLKTLSVTEPNASTTPSENFPSIAGYQEFTITSNRPVEEKAEPAAEAEAISPSNNLTVEEKPIETQDEKQIDIPTLMGEAEGYVNYRLWNKAEEILRQIILVDPGHVEAQNLLQTIRQSKEGVDMIPVVNDPSFSELSPAEEPELLSKETTSPSSLFSLDDGKIEEKLAEGEFYSQQGLLGEARIIYETILRFSPDNTLAKIKLKKVLIDLNETENTAILDPVQEISEAVSLELPAEPADVQPEEITDRPPPAPKNPSPASFVPGKVKLKTTVLDKTEKTDFVNLLGELEEDFEDDFHQAPEAEIQDDDFSKVIKEFQRGIQKNIGEKDFETHFNLGIAYKEMGLRTEAIGEFQISVKGAARTVDSAVMLAQCYVEEGLTKLAVEQILQAIQIKELNSDQIHSLKYELANLYELQETFQEAIDVLSDIYKENVHYRDVAKKITLLRKKNN
ncbi:MAG: tetratricopeptide repeat protein [Nitrospirae bacterium]|nr:tetratricopeptide repeat protein [Nitrospirota bacterium]